MLHVLVEQMPVFMENYSIHEAMLEILLQKGASLFRRDAAGRTPQDCTLDGDLLRVILRVQKRWNTSELLCALKSCKNGEALPCLEVPEVLACVVDFL